MCWLWGDFLKRKKEKETAYRLLRRVCGDSGHDSHSLQRGALADGGERENQSTEKITTPKIRKLKEDSFLLFFFIHPSFFPIFSFFLSSFFVFVVVVSRDWLPAVEKKNGEQRTEDNLKINGQNNNDKKRTKPEHVRNKPNPQRRFVEQWGKDFWGICFFLHTSPVRVCCRPFRHVFYCMSVRVRVCTFLYAHRQETEGMIDNSSCLLYISPSSIFGMEKGGCYASHIQPGL